MPEFPTHDLGVRLLRKSVNERLEAIEKRANRVKREHCIASQREVNILEEDIGEVYSKGSKQMARLRKIKKRICL